MKSPFKKTPTKLLILSLMAGASLVALAPGAEARGRGGERPAFETLDQNSDGAVTQAELQSGLEAARATRFARADTDGDGTLSREELAAQVEGRRAARLDRMFERLDANDDGALSEAELADRPRRGDGAPRLERLFDRADADGNGALSAQEWEEFRPGRGRGRH